MSTRGRYSIHDFPLSEYTLHRFSGACLELVNELLHSHPTGEILWMDNPCSKWRYHVALVLDGLVYDAWYPDVRLPPGDYVQTVFGSHVTWEINPGRTEYDE